LAGRGDSEKIRPGRGSDMRRHDAGVARWHFNGRPRRDRGRACV